MAHLELEIARHDGGDHVTGTVRREDGETVTFVGWIALLALLQAAVGG